MKSLYKNISSFLIVSAMVIGFQTAYATGHETAREGNTEAQELLGNYLDSQTTAPLNTTYSFYDSDAELVAEYTLEDSEASSKLTKMLQKSDLIMDKGKTKLYMVD